MSVQRVGTGTSTPVVPGTRGRLLALLRAADRPLTVDELASALDLHRNTVRFHMEALAEVGLVHEGRQLTGTKGRPRAVFSPTSSGTRSGERNFQLLASVLTDHLARTSADPAADAHAAGVAWGQRLSVTARGAPRKRTSRAQVIEALDAMGFEPRPTPATRPTRIQLHNCPFREVVDEQQTLVCAMHAGLIHGMTAHPDASPDGAPAVRLEPFATPHLCVVHLAPSTGTTTPER